MSPRGGGGAPSGWASLWEYRAAQSRQARAEEAQGASWGTAKAGTLTVLQRPCRMTETHDLEEQRQCDAMRDFGE